MSDLFRNIKNRAAKSFVLLCALFLSPVLSGEVIIQPEKSAVICDKKDLGTAKMLVEHLQRISGIAPEINPSNTSGKYLFCIGKAPADKKLTGKFIDECFWFIGSDAAWFYGNTPQTTAYAVSDFLEKALAVRWPQPGVICAAPQNPLKISIKEGSFKSNMLRSLIRYGSKEHYAWSFHFKSRVAKDHLNYGHSRIKWWGFYGKTHPEYFALYRGERKPPRDSEWGRKVIAICASCPGVVDQIIKEWNKKRYIINICENDGWSEFSCSCSNCRALDADPKGKLDNNMGADRYVYLGNKVLEAARKIRPDAKVVYYAYNASTCPPRKTKLADGTIIGIVPTDFRRKELSEYVQAWKKAGMTEFFYRPNFQHHYLSIGFPMGRDRMLFRIQEFLQQNGAVGFDYDAPVNYDPFRWREDYILLHALAEPGRSYEYWEEHYASAFGKAAPEVIAYYRFWTDIWEKRVEKDIGKLVSEKNLYNFHVAFLPQIGKYYRPDDFKRSGRLLNAALKKDISPEARKLLEELKLFHDHALLMLNAYNRKSKENVQAVIAFRRQNCLPALMPWENLKGCGDLLGVTAPEMQPEPSLALPLWWNFKLDPQEKGINEKWFAVSADLAKWDGMMPTDSVWEKPVVRNGHPSAELQKRTADYNGKAWYACDVKLPADFRSRQIIIRFGAVDESADIWVNGKKSGSRPFKNPDDWRLPFEIDITGQIDWNADTQRIAVMVTDTAGAGGIWKPVHLIAREKWQKVDAFRNPGFEMRPGTRQCPHWTQNARFGMAMHYHTDNPRSGKACGKQISGKTTFDVVSAAVIPVKPGERFRLTLWNRNTITSGNSLFGIRFADAKNLTLKNGYTFYKTIPGQKEWKQYEMIFEIPAGCTQIQLYFKAEKPIGDIFWDDIQLEKSSSERIQN